MIVLLDMLNITIEMAIHFIMMQGQRKSYRNSLIVNLPKHAHVVVIYLIDGTQLHVHVVIRSFTVFLVCVYYNKKSHSNFLLG